MYRSLYHSFKKFNISPYRPDLISGIFILIWGLNVVLYLGNQLSTYCDVSPTEKSITKVKKQIISDAVPDESEKIYFSCEYYSGHYNTDTEIKFFKEHLSPRAPPFA